MTRNFILAALCLVAAGCTGTTDPNKATTADIIFGGDKIQGEIDRKKGVSEILKSEQSATQTDIQRLAEAKRQREAELARQNAEVEVMQKRLIELDKQVAVKEREKELTAEKVAEMAKRRTKLEATRAKVAGEGDVAARQKLIDELNAEIEALYKYALE